MHCSYVYDGTLNLIALTATEGNGRRWTTILDGGEWDEVADRALDRRWSPNRQPLNFDNLADLVRDVTGRDPRDG